MNRTRVLWLRRIQTLSIRTKLALVSGLVVFALISIPYVSWYRDASIRDMNNTRLAILSLDRMLLSLQRSQNDFINLFDPRYQDEFSLIFETFVESTEDLKVQFWSLDLPIETLEQLVVLTSEYQYLFEVMAELQQQIGQDDNKGIQKRISDGLKSTDAAIQQAPADDKVRLTLQRHAAMLQLTVQDLMIGHKMKQIDVFDQQYTQMIKDTEALVQDTNARTRILTAMADYHQAFVDLSNATMRVGLSYEDGLHHEIGDIVRKAQQVIDKLNVEVDAAIHTRERRLNIALGMMAGFFTVLFMMAVVMFFRSISAPIRGVTAIMTRLADGDLTVNIPNDARRDEIGDMFRALRVFKMGSIIRRRTQDELRKAHAELEQRVEERTRALSEEIVERRLAEKKLDHARKEAEDANRAKSLFLANMSHELRTPLNAIIGYAEMLQEDALDDGNTHLSNDLDKIHGAGKHLLGIINEILDLSKIEAGRVDVHLETFAILDVLETVTDTVQPLIAANGNAFVLDADKNLGDMNSDLTRLRQILFNFLSNAAKFTEKGTITLACRRNADTVTFSVSDTGIGLSEEQIKHVFEPFTQADASTTRKYGGTGLGLTVNREFARLLGGEIEVESHLGEGSTFTVHLPASASVKPVKERRKS
ncbi:MAG: ATP-binding protein [Rhodospirillales bacterium]|nr:ATP-binding protein [Rhodospirillales bacterium]